MKTLSVIISILMTMSASVLAGGFVSVLDGFWEDATTWAGTSVFPTDTDQVLIDHKIHSQGNCKNLYLSDNGELCSGITVEGYIVNYGLIMNDSAHKEDSFILRFKENLDNYNTIVAHETYLTGTTKQTITQYDNKPINFGICRVVNPQNNVYIAKKMAFSQTSFFGGGATLIINKSVNMLKYQGGTIDGCTFEGNNTILCCDSTMDGDVTEIGWSGPASYAPQFTKLKKVTLASNKYIKISAEGVGELGVELYNCTNNTSLLGAGDLYTSSTFTNNHIIANQPSQKLEVWCKNTFINNGTVLATLNVLGNVFMNISATWDQSIIKMNGYVNQEIIFNKDILPEALTLESNVANATTYQWYLDGKVISGEEGQELDLKRNNPESLGIIKGVYHCVTDKGSSRTISVISGFEPPAMPLGLIGNTSNDTITLSWNANTEFDFSHYNIFVDDSLLHETTKNTYVYDNFSIGDTFSISAIDVSDYESDKATVSTFNIILGLLERTVLFSFSIYPNPTNDYITVTEINNNAAYSIISINGTVVKTGSLSNTENQINAKNLPAGIYTFVLIKDDKRFTKQLVIR